MTYILVLLHTEDMTECTLRLQSHKALNVSVTDTHILFEEVTGALMKNRSINNLYFPKKKKKLLFKERHKGFRKLGYLSLSHSPSLCPSLRHV